MIDPCEPCAQTTAENVRQRIGEPGPHHRSLSIAILGPAVGGSSNAGGRKRQQIRRQLREAGHCPFYPEERIGPDGLWVDRERAVLSDASVDLIIVLQTDDSIGVMGELTAFVTEDAIVAKTAVLTPARYYRPEQSFLANAVTLLPGASALHGAAVCGMSPAQRLHGDNSRSLVRRLAPRFGSRPLIGCARELPSNHPRAMVMAPQKLRLHPYPAYTPSGLPGLGDVPAHWEVRRAKYFYRESQEVSASGAEELMSVSHRTGVTPRKANVTMFLAESNVGYKICRPDDIVINTMWAYMAALGVARQVGIVSPSYGVYRPREPALMNPDYVDALLRTEDYRTEYTRRSTGITDSRLRLYPEQFLEIPLLCPPLAEQAAIVRYLDHADELINRYISAKERLVTLLEDQRQTAIHQAVTRGLDPNVRLKPSGVTLAGRCAGALGGATAETLGRYQ